MSWSVLRRRAAVLAGLAALLVGAPARAADALAFADIAGWWAAEPAFGGESSPVLLHFVEDKGKQTVRLSMLAIGGFDVPVGTVKLAGDGLDMEPMPFPLRYDRSAGTLSGFLPEAAVPVYRIPVEFRRVAPMEKPPAPAWTAASPRIKWQFDVKAPVWAGLAHDAETGRLFVATDAGVLHAIDTGGPGAGAAAWTFDTGKPSRRARRSSATRSTSSPTAASCTSSTSKAASSAGARRSMRRRRRACRARTRSRAGTATVRASSSTARGSTSPAATRPSTPSTSPPARSSGAWPPATS